MASAGQREAGCRQPQARAAPSYVGEDSPHAEGSTCIRDNPQGLGAAGTGPRDARVPRGAPGWKQARADFAFIQATGEANEPAVRATSPGHRGKLPRSSSHGKRTQSQSHVPPVATTSGSGEGQPLASGTSRGRLSVDQTQGKARQKERMESSPGATAATRRPRQASV